MRQIVLAALILAVGLIVGGYLAGGRYTIVASQGNSVARLDRFTGNVSMCVVGVGCDYVIRR